MQLVVNLSQQHCVMLDVRQDVFHWSQRPELCLAPQVAKWSDDGYDEEIPPHVAVIPRFISRDVEVVEPVCEDESEHGKGGWRGLDPLTDADTAYTPKELKARIACIEGRSGGATQVFRRTLHPALCLDGYACVQFLSLGA